MLFRFPACCARGARDYQPAAEVLPVGEALPPRPRQVNRLLEKLGRAKCPIIGAGRGVIGAFDTYGRKWLDRKGRAIHTESDFMRPLYEWGDALFANAVKI